jgi:hypothetical protein
VDEVVPQPARSSIRKAITVRMGSLYRRSHKGLIDGLRR